MGRQRSGVMADSDIAQEAQERQGVDVLVLGGGPAALCIAAAMAQACLRVALLAPQVRTFLTE